MRVGLIANAYNEARFLEPFLNHVPEWVEEKLVLITAKPWYGDDLEDDGSERLAKDLGATVIVYPWKDEVEQRNAAQQYFDDFDWVLTIEPDEFLDNKGWERLHEFLLTADKTKSYVVKQRVFWGKGFESDPPEEFMPVIVTPPSARFWEKRNIDTVWEPIPDLTLLHFAWARTDDEIWKKISHYSHAVDFDIDDWYKNVWLARKTENVHPTTPSAIPRLIKAVLPKEIEELNIWPK